MRESAGGKTKHHRSRDAVGIRGVRQAARKRHECLLSSDRGVKPAVESGLSSRSKPAKPRKKKGKRNADRRVVHDPRFGAARADRSALACRRSTTALAAANERRSSTPATRFL
jgi:hypothetical protein